MGQTIAETARAGSSIDQDTDLRLIGRYNPPGWRPTPIPRACPAFPPALSRGKVTGGRAGAVLDLIAAAESRGNYNAWHGNAAQRDVDLSALSVNEVRALQAELVRSSGGSAIGRYQILDDTLGSLAARLACRETTVHAGATGPPGLAARAGCGPRPLVGRPPVDGQFATNLSQIWAGLPTDATTAALTWDCRQSGDLNYDAMLTSLRSIRPEA